MDLYQLIFGLGVVFAVLILGMVFAVSSQYSGEADQFTLEMAKLGLIRDENGNWKKVS